MRMRFMLLGLCGLLAGCASYAVPGGKADFSQLGLTLEAKAALTDHSVQALLDKKPLVTFPATIAVARVQAANYDSYSYHPYAGPYRDPRNTYSVITIPDVEKDADFADIARLPRVAGVAPIKQILLDAQLSTDLELRNAAAKLHANLLLYYTLDTEFHTDSHVEPLGVISLGIFPNKVANVSTTASAVLMDVNNGYIYCVAESTTKNDQLANAWTSDEAIDQVRKHTERQAFVGLLGQIKTQWPTVVANYDHALPPTTAPTAAAK